MTLGEQDPGAGGQDGGRVPTQAFDRRRSLIGAVIAAVFLTVVFARVIPQVGDYAGALDVITALRFTDLMLLLGALLLYLALYGLPFVAAAPGLSYVNSQIVNNSRFAIGNGIPGGGAFSVAVGYAQLVSYRQTPTAATAAIGASSVWSSFATLALPITGVAALVLSGGNASRFVVPALIGLAVLLVVIVLFALILRSERNAARIGAFADRAVGAVLRRVRPHSSINITAGIADLRHDIVGLVTRRWVAITFATIGVSLGQFTILATAASLVADPGIPILAVYAAWAISQIGILIPLTPGGLGTVDAAMIALLVGNGMSQADATAAALLWRATFYFPQIALGVVCIFVWRWQAARDRRNGVSRPA